MNRALLSSTCRHRIALLLAAIPIWNLVGCVTPAHLGAPNVSPGEQDAATGEMTSKMLLDLVGHRKRILDIEYQLARITAPKCGTMRRPHPGILVTDPKSNAGTNVDGVAFDMKIQSEKLTILYVSPGGSFDRGGLLIGDEILALDDEPTRSAKDIRNLMLSSGTRESVRVKVRRDPGGTFETRIQLDMTCPVRFRLIASPLIIPLQADRLLVSIPLGLVERVRDDSTLAVVIAHQVAHTLFDKADDDALGAEMRADRIGIRMAAAAGYDTGGAAAYWEDVAAEYPALIGSAPAAWQPMAWKQEGDEIETSHPEIAARMQAIRALVRDVVRDVHRGNAAAKDSREQ